MIHSESIKTAEVPGSIETAEVIGTGEVSRVHWESRRSRTNQTQVNMKRTLGAILPVFIVCQNSKP